MNTQTACSEEEGIQGWWKNNKSYQDTRALSDELFKVIANIKKKNENRKHLGNMSFSCHNKENICPSKNEIRDFKQIATAVVDAESWEEYVTVPRQFQL